MRGRGRHGSTSPPRSRARRASSTARTPTRCTKRSTCKALRESSRSSITSGLRRGVPYAPETMSKSAASSYTILADCRWFTGRTTIPRTAIPTVSFACAGGCTHRRTGLHPQELGNRDEMVAFAFECFHDEARRSDVGASIAGARRYLRSRADDAAVAVVECDDGAVARVTQNARSDHMGRRILPVVRERHRPHHRRIAELAHFVEHQPIARTKRRPHDARMLLRRCVDCGIGPLEGAAQPAGIVEDQMAVTPGVIADRIAVGGFELHYAGIRRDGAP